MPARDFFDDDVATVARSLIGARFLVDGVGGVIVETEAYDHEDPASHSFRGETAANAAMFGVPGSTYVYRSYGVHWCFNIVCRPGSAVLIRALEPVAGLEIMAERRGTGRIENLCSGPGKLCQALAITIAHTRRDVLAAPFTLSLGEPCDAIVCGPRIGITKAAETPWRFGRLNSPFLSRRFAPTKDEIKPE